jgi:gas vesicle protein
MGTWVSRVWRRRVDPHPSRNRNYRDSYENYQWKEGTLMEKCSKCGCNSTCSKCGGNLVLGLLAGAAIGAAVGMLFTPHKGTVLRKIIRRKGEDIASDVAETIEDRIEQLSDTFSEKLESLKSEIQSRVNQARNFSSD